MSKAPDACPQGDGTAEACWVPLLVNLKGRTCVVVGGGEVASRKVGFLLSTGCRLKVISPQATSQIRDLSDAGKLHWEAREIQASDLAGASLVVVATDNEDLNTVVAQWAREQGALCNVVDRPELCDVYFPAILSRGTLIVSVSTCGASPALAAVIRDRIGVLLGAEYGIAARLLARIRHIVQKNVSDKGKRHKILKGLVHEALFEGCRRRDSEALWKFISDVGVPVSRNEIQAIINEVGK